MKKTRKRAHPLKCLVVAIVIAISLTMAGQAKAADWSNEHFSCDIVVSKSGGNWYEVWLWGVWTRIGATFYETGGEANMKTAYVCTIVSNGPNYICRVTDQNYFYFVSRAEEAASLELKKGISKREACEEIFKVVRIRWWLRGR